MRASRSRRRQRRTTHASPLKSPESRASSCRAVRPTRGTGIARSACVFVPPLPLPPPGPDVASTVILVNLGTTEAPTADAVRSFLHEFLGDPLVVDWPAWIWKPVLERVVLRTRPRRVARLYASIWSEDGPPLRVETQRLGDQLQGTLGPETRVEVAYRYGSPGLASVVREARTLGPVTVISLFPHRTSSTTGTLDALVEQVVREGKGHAVQVLHPEPDDPGYVEGLVGRWEEALDEAEEEPEHLVLSYHGIPVRHDRREGGTYRAGCLRTTRAFLERISWDPTRATTTFQSRFGPEPWLRPATDVTLANLARQGIGRVAVLTPGFLTEGLETLEEIGVEARHTFLEAGGKSFLRVPCVGAHPELVGGLACLARGSMEARPSVADEGPHR
ncbi:MAG: ferrochelatase [Gemmatimonadales bacterium]|nr:MAG: ferrochelatase [Gemmatimonadales bacterium]